MSSCCALPERPPREDEPRSTRGGGVASRAMSTSAEVLSKVPLFSMLSKRELDKLAKDVHDRTFPAGSVLTDQDDF